MLVFGHGVVDALRLNLLDGGGRNPLRPRFRGISPVISGGGAFERALVKPNRERPAPRGGAGKQVA